MNRRGFLGFLAAGMLSVAIATKLGSVSLPALTRNQSDLIALIEARLKAAKENMYNALAFGLYRGAPYDATADSVVLSPSEYSWKESKVEFYINNE